MRKGLGKGPSVEGQVKGGVEVDVHEEEEREQVEVVGLRVDHQGEQL